MQSSKIRVFNRYNGKKFRTCSTWNSPHWKTILNKMYRIEPIYAFCESSMKWKLGARSHTWTRENSRGVFWVKYRMPSVRAERRTGFCTGSQVIQLKLVDHSRALKQKTENGQKIIKMHFCGTGRHIDGEKRRRETFEHLLCWIHGSEYPIQKSIIFHWLMFISGNGI